MGRLYLLMVKILARVSDHGESVIYNGTKLDSSYKDGRVGGVKVEFTLFRGANLHKFSRNSTPSTHAKDGGKFIIKPYALDIIWGGDSRYWRKPAQPQDPAELLQVSWLEVTGSIDLDKLKIGQEYRVSFKVSLKTDAFGWADSPVYLMAKPGKGAPPNWKKADLSTNKAGEIFETPPDLKFKVPDKVDGEKLQFGMYEIWKGRWKGGLTIHEVIIEPTII